MSGQPADTNVPPAGTSWFRSMSGAERRTFWGCFGGWAVDAMDVQMFSLELTREDA